MVGNTSDCLTEAFSDDIRRISDAFPTNFRRISDGRSDRKPTENRQDNIGRIRSSATMFELYNHSPHIQTLLTYGKE